MTSIWGKKKKSLKIGPIFKYFSREAKDIITALFEMCSYPY